jgi:hypothetical protein
MNVDEFVPSLSTFGRKARAVTPSDVADLPAGKVKAVVLLSAGNVSVIPADNADNEPVSFTDVPAGFIPPFVVRRVRATGTTATVATIED